MGLNYKNRCVCLWLLFFTSGCGSAPLQEPTPKTAPPRVRDAPETDHEAGGESVAPVRNNEKGDPGNAGVRRLSARQYNRTLAAVLGPKAAKVAVALPDAVNTPTDTIVQTLANNAQTVARAWMETGANGLVPCDPQTTTAASDCAAKAIDNLGPLILRRPLQERERTILLAVFERSRTLAGVSAGFEAVANALLMNPSFLFQIEKGKWDVEGGRERWLAPRELAHRLAYVLWATPADRTLLARVANGSLSTPSAIRLEVEAMLKDPRSREGVLDFYTQWLELDNVLKRFKEPKRFPTWSKELATEAFEESMQFVSDNFFNEGGNLTHLLTSRSSVVQPKLAELYGMRGAIGRIDLPRGERSGIFTRVAFLAGGSSSWSTQPASRGRSILDKLLCSYLPPPPNEVSAPTAPSEPWTRTTRQILEGAISGANQCRGCHQLIDPVGFAFEEYDAIGAYRTTEHNLPIDSSGSLTTTVGNGDINGKWNNANDLSDWLARLPSVKTCVAAQFWRYATGHKDADDDHGRVIGRISKVLGRPNAGIKDLMIETLADDAFRKVLVGQAEERPLDDVQGIPDGRTPQETLARLAAREFKAAAIELPAQSRDVLQQWSLAFAELAQRVAAGR